MSEYNYRKLPRPIQGRVEELEEALRHACGEKLRALVIHGSAARGDYRPDESDVDLILVLEEASRALLEKIAPALDVARAAARIETMILVESEISSAADVFPLLYHDIKNAHHLLCGQDPFAELEISPTHVRLRIEQELRELSIRLRRRVTDARHHPATLSGVVTRKTRQARFPLRALLEAMGEGCKDDHEAVITKAARVFRVDPSDLLRPGERPQSAVDSLIDLLSRACAKVDSLAEPATSEASS